jgi:hypothetical protein
LVNCFLAAIFELATFLNDFLIKSNIMKNILNVIFLIILFSCGAKKKDSTINIKPTEKLVGSTLDNINNSQHAVIEFNVDNKLCFATINQYFKGFSNKKAFPYSLWITVETKEKNRNGHPVDAEAIMYNKLEDSIIYHFISSTPFCFIGRTARNGYRELMFYVADKDKAIDVMNSYLVDNKFERKIKYQITFDPTWESVGGFY